MSQIQLLSDSNFEPFTDDDVQKDINDEDVIRVKENVRNERARRQQRLQIEKAMGCHEEATVSGKEAALLDELGDHYEDSDDTLYI